MDYKGTDRRAQCLEHSGMIEKLTAIEKEATENKIISRENCKKLDSIKLWLIGLLGAVVVQLAIQLFNGG